MDKDGKCDVIRLPFLQDENDRPELVSQGPKTTKQQELLRCLAGLNHERFVAMCVLGGCDYTNHVHISTKEEVVEGHLLAEKTFMEHKVFDPRTKRVVLIRALDTQEEVAGTEMASEDASARAIEIASGLIDPRTGGMRQTQLSPAERELIKVCQERAFYGLESQQLKAQAAAYKAEALRKQAEERALREAAFHKVGGDAIERKEEKQKLVKGASAVNRIETSSKASEIKHEARRIAVVDLEGELTAGFDAFSASGASACTSNSLSVAAGASTDSMHLARQLLSEMTPQGFQLSCTAITRNASGDQSARTPNPPGGLGTASSQLQNTLVTAGETECVSSSQESSSALATCNLDQFAFNWDKTEGGSQPARTRRRAIVTKTRFAHRTQLVSAAEPRCPPFPSLTSSAEATVLVEANAVTLSERPKGASPIPESLEPQAKRRSVSFLRANDSGTTSAFLTIRFAQERPKRHKPL
ncbi:hypothetical protein Emag_001749 [Eimeria magna]